MTVNPINAELHPYLARNNINPAEIVDYEIKREHGAVHGVKVKLITGEVRDLNLRLGHVGSGPPPGTGV